MGELSIIVFVVCAGMVEFFFEASVFEELFFEGADLSCQQVGGYSN